MCLIVLPYFYQAEFDFLVRYEQKQELFLFCSVKIVSVDVILSLV